MLEYIHYLIYPIAALLIILAIGGLNTKQPIIIGASLFSLALNTYAIIGYLWWPIAASLVVDFGFKRFFVDPGAHPD